MCSYEHNKNHVKEDIAGNVLRASTSQSNNFKETQCFLDFFVSTTATQVKNSKHSENKCYAVFTFYLS